MYLHRLLIAALLCGVITSSARAEEGEHASDYRPVLDQVGDFVSQGKASVSGRYRFEYVDQDGLSKNAKASTLRTRLGFTTGSVFDLSGKLEFEDVSEIGSDTYNSTVNGKTDYPVVADPENTTVNEAYLTYQGLPDTSVRGGREALVVDNVRFIGDVGWRQNNQTFDGVNVTNQSLPDTRFWYGYVGRVNRIFGDDSDVGDFDTNLQLFNISYSGLKFAKLIGYAYLYDVKDSTALSTSNYGAHVLGDTALDDELKVLYDLEYAYQRDYEDNPKDFSADYWRAELGLGLGSCSIKGGYENLGSDDGNAGFSTPFATLHKWNGWADKFLTTPDAGLQDAYAALHVGTSTPPHEYVKALAFDAVYHYFSADDGNSKFGDELDFQVTADILKYLQFGVKYALYDSANFATDTDKLIFTLQAGLSQ